MPRYDVAIIGSGFAGSILARVLNRLERRVLLIERGSHPRFALGESTTPLANLVLERLARRYDLPDLHHLSTHGRWLAHLPHLRRGLKRGFTFYRHRRGEPYRNPPPNQARLMVAASPNDAIADTHWLRRDVDHHLVQRAVAEGVDYFDETEVGEVDFAGGGARLEARRRGRRLRFDSDLVIDGSGPGGCLARALPIASTTDRIPFSSGLLYGHFEGLDAFVDVAGLEPGPYPDERAAVHHLLDFGWMYVLPFDHGVASAGMILFADADRPPIDEIRRDPARAWRRLLERYPTLADQFSSARAVTPIRFVPRIQHRLSAAAGAGWFLLPHAYAFFDPLFSTGIAWSLLAVERLADLAEGGGQASLYGSRLADEADQIERLIECGYRASNDFELFAAVGFLYFASVSSEEARQRLADPVPGAPAHAWTSFLGASDARSRALFEEARRRLREPAARGARELEAWIRRRIEPFDVAGFSDPGRGNLYPVDLDLLVESAHLLGFSRQEVEAALPRLRGQGT